MTKAAGREFSWHSAGPARLLRRLQSCDVRQLWWRIAAPADKGPPTSRNKAVISRSLLARQDNSSRNEESMRMYKSDCAPAQLEAVFLGEIVIGTCAQKCKGLSWSQGIPQLPISLTLSMPGRRGCRMRFTARTDTTPSLQQSGTC